MVCVFQKRRPYLAVFVYSAILLVHLLFAGFSPSAGAEDIIPPTVTSTEPANGATGVSRNLERVSFLFSEPMMIGSQAITSNWGPYSISWAPNGTRLDLERGNLEIPLPGSTTFNLILNAPGVPYFRDLAKNPLETFTLSFTTEEDNVVPTVVSTNPSNGSTDVSPDLETISITFSEAMEPSYSFTTQGDWALATTTWSQDQRTAFLTRLNAGVDLLSGTNVTITLNPQGAPNFQDISDNYLDTYVLSFSVAGTAPYQLLKIPADPTNGFHWPYYLSIPQGITSQTVILVEPNNSGFVDDDPESHDAAAETLALLRTPFAVELGTPLLVPTFPRPATYWPVYVQALDRDTLLTNLEGLQRVDLQLIAMIDDARARLAALGISTGQKVFMNGFSASGSFVNRFTLLHPERVKAAAAGSGGCPMVPVSEWNGHTLRYPVGVSDLELLTGNPFNLNEYRKVPKYIYVGDKDDNDAVDYSDGFDDQDRDLIYEIFGDPVYIYQRWLIAEQIFNSVNAHGQFVVYPGVGHNITLSMWEDLQRFFLQNKRNSSSLPFMLLLLGD